MCSRPRRRPRAGWCHRRRAPRGAAPLRSRPRTLCHSRAPRGKHRRAEEEGMTRAPETWSVALQKQGGEPRPPPLFARGWLFERSNLRNPCVYRHFLRPPTCPFPGQTWSPAGRFPLSSVVRSRRVPISSMVPRRVSRRVWRRERRAEQSAVRAESGARCRGRRTRPRSSGIPGRRFLNAAKTRSKDVPWKSFSDVTKGAEIRSGIFTLYLKRDKAYFALRGQLDRDYLLVTQLSQGSAGWAWTVAARCAPTWSAFTAPATGSSSGWSILALPPHPGRRWPGLLTTPSVTPSPSRFPSPPCETTARSLSMSPRSCCPTGPISAPSFRESPFSESSPAHSFSIRIVEPPAPPPLPGEPGGPGPAHLSGEPQSRASRPWPLPLDPGRGPLFAPRAPSHSNATPLRR